MRKRLGSEHDQRDLSSRRLALVALVIVCLVTLTIGVGLAWHSHQSSIASPVASTPATTARVTGQCHSVNGVDPTCIPGVADPRVTQDNILTTICVSGYT